MKDYLTDAKTKCPWKGQSIDEFLMKEVSIIYENHTMLDVVNCFTVDHELEYWQIWMFMNTLLTSFTTNKMLEMLVLIVGCIS
jgi:hypothetical protein